MFAANGSRSDLSLRHALAGLQAGVLGALIMLGYVMIGARWDQRSIWVVPNLFATTFFGNDAYRNEFLRHSLAGAALLIAIYGLLGILWGCLWRDRTVPWLTLYGAIAGLAVYFLFFDFIWKHLNPLIGLYAPDRQLEVGHLLWGMILGMTPAYARRIAERLHPAAVDVPPQIPAQTGEAIR